MKVDDAVETISRFFNDSGRIFATLDQAIDHLRDL